VPRIFSEFASWRFFSPETWCSETWCSNHSGTAPRIPLIDYFKAPGPTIPTGIRLVEHQIDEITQALGHDSHSFVAKVDAAQSLIYRFAFAKSVYRQVWVRSLRRKKGLAVIADWRNIWMYGWAWDSKTILYERDSDGDENYHAFAVDQATPTFATLLHAGESGRNSSPRTRNSRIRFWSR
jgi:hypothetical protein